MLILIIIVVALGTENRRLIQRGILPNGSILGGDVFGVREGLQSLLVCNNT